MNLPKDAWRDVIRAIDATLRLDDEGQHPMLRGARTMICDTCKSDQGAEVEINRPLEKFVDLHFAIKDKSLYVGFETALMACLYDREVDW